MYVLNNDFLNKTKKKIKKWVNNDTLYLKIRGSNRGIPHPFTVQSIPGLANLIPVLVIIWKIRVFLNLFNLYNKIVM